MIEIDLKLLPPKEKRLWVGETEVGVVYMRCGYHPDQYPTQRLSIQQLDDLCLSFVFGPLY